MAVCDFNDILILSKCLNTVCCQSKKKRKRKDKRSKSCFFLLLYLVALNFQTAGEGMDLNDGLFSQNGSCGYTLKPSFMREAEKRFDPETPQKRNDYQPVVLTIQVQSKGSKTTCTPEVHQLFQSLLVTDVFVCLR